MYRESRDKVSNYSRLTACVASQMAGAAVLVGASVSMAFAQETPLTADQSRLRAIYKELVEIDTSPSGSCTRAVQAVARRFRGAGFPAADVRVLTPPGAPKKGNLVARLRGSGAQKPLLLLAHIDVVEALRETWKTDPFKLTETGGYFYGRGAADNKAMASILTANLLRFHAEKYRPDRDLILALTCDEEIIPSDYNGVDFLLKNHRDLIDAELALNEGGGGELDREGKRVRISIQAGRRCFKAIASKPRTRAGTARCRARKTRSTTSPRDSHGSGGSIFPRASAGHPSHVPGDVVDPDGAGGRRYARAGRQPGG